MQARNIRQAVIIPTSEVGRFRRECAEPAEAKPVAATLEERGMAERVKQLTDRLRRPTRRPRILF